jgi:methionine-rich copper-binding protein CopC
LARLIKSDGQGEGADVELRQLGRGRWTIMMSRRAAIVALSSAGMLCARAPARADEEVHVMQSTPAASAVIAGRSSEFFVRFDRPVDHIHSTLAIMRDGTLVERLTPRLESAPEVLFARAPTLPPGSYMLHWAVRTMEKVDVIQGDIPFTVKD